MLISFEVFFRAEGNCVFEREVLDFHGISFKGLRGILQGLGKWNSQDEFCVFFDEILVNGIPVYSINCDALWAIFALYEALRNVIYKRGVGFGLGYFIPCFEEILNQRRIQILADLTDHLIGDVFVQNSVDAFSREIV